MGYSWTVYTPLPQTEARKLVGKVYRELERIVGPELVEAIEEDGYPEELGRWPSLEVSGADIPTPQEERAVLDGPNKIGVSFEDAAVARLASCKSRIDIDRPSGLEDDPTLVSAMLHLFRNMGPSVFCKNRGFDLTTSETMVRKLEKARDLRAALIEYDEDDIAEEEAEEPEESAAAAPEALHRLLTAIAEHLPARRRVGEALETAAPAVQKYVRHLGQYGPMPDAKVAAALSLDVKAVAAARQTLAELLERAERRR